MEECRLTSQSGGTGIRMGLLDRLLDKTRKIENGCWLFLGSRDSDGYGRLVYEGRVENVNRLSCHLYHGLELRDLKKRALHKLECSNKNCWNPEHLYVGTNSDNIQDQQNAGQHWQTNKTHCKYGHEFTKENTYVNSRYGRECKICRSNKQRQRRYGGNGIHN